MECSHDRKIVQEWPDLASYFNGTNSGLCSNSLVQNADSGSKDWKRDVLLSFCPMPVTFLWVHHLTLTKRVDLI